MAARRLIAGLLGSFFADAARERILRELASSRLARMRRREADARAERDAARQDMAVALRDALHPRAEDVQRVADRVRRAGTQQQLVFALDLIVMDVLDRRQQLLRRSAEVID